MNQKPAKPYTNFPLTAHSSGQWCKKINGNIYYFGKWSDPEAAVKLYHKEVDDIKQGRRPRRGGDGISCEAVINLFLEQQENSVDAGQISRRTYQDYKLTCSFILNTLGRNVDATQLRAQDFAKLRLQAASRFSVARLDKVVTVTRMVFKWAYDTDLLEVPLKFGPNFKGVSKKSKREQRNRSQKKVFTREEILTLLEAANTEFRAMIYLGINCGLGNTDIATITVNHIQGEWLDFPRQKTAVSRLIHLWPETREAIEEALKVRPRPKPGNGKLVFVTPGGEPVVRVRDKCIVDEVSEGFRKLLRSVGLKGDKLSAKERYRPSDGRSFYALRHTTQTVGEGCLDRVATSAIMGHVDSSMADVYREEIEQSRLKAVTDHIRYWLMRH